MSKDYNFEVGYEALWKEWEIQKKRTPRGVTLVKGGNNIYLQFKTPNTTRSKYKCACVFSIDGMHEAVRKSHLVKTKLTNLASEVEFWNWYKKEIEEESQLVDDQLTFGEAIAKVEDDFWGRPDRRKRRRDKENPSDTNSWKETYGRFLDVLPDKHKVSLSGLELGLKNWTKGRRSYKYAVSAYKKMCRTIKRVDLLEYLDELDVVQTERNELQSVTLSGFLNWRNELLGITSDLHPNVQLDIRKSWLWVFSMQIVYGLRISEVFAITNLLEPYLTKDGVVIPALSALENVENVIVIGELTLLGTTTKTGYRLSKPIVPPKYSNLLDTLAIKTPLLPNNRPGSGNDETIRKFYGNKARRLLTKWNAPFTQTHALRHLANINGMQAGISQEVRAQSLGHTVGMNESTYKKRQSTQTTLDLYNNSNQNAIDFVTALAETKKLLKTDPESKEFASRILSIIYQKNSNEIYELL